MLWSGHVQSDFGPTLLAAAGKHFGRHTGTVPDPADPDGPDATATTCHVCGTVAPDGRPATWSLQVGSSGRQWLCEACTRNNVRSIEGKLDKAWW